MSLIAFQPHYPIVTGPANNWIAADGTDSVNFAMSALTGAGVVAGSKFKLSVDIRTSAAFPAGSFNWYTWARGYVRITSGNISISMGNAASGDVVLTVSNADLPTGDVLLEVEIDGSVPSCIIKFNGVVQTHTPTTLAAGTINFVSGGTVGVLATQSAATPANIMANCSWANLRVWMNDILYFQATENAAGLNASFNEVAPTGGTITGSFADAP